MLFVWGSNGVDNLVVCSRTFVDTSKYDFPVLLPSKTALTTAVLLVPDCVLLDEHPQPAAHHLLCSRQSLCLHLVIQGTHCQQSGHSLIEHSYKADSDLSPGGWEYAERLKEFVVERRAKVFDQKGLDPQDHRLVVSTVRPRVSPHF